jgi:hypothetical protein
MNFREDAYINPRYNEAERLGVKSELLSIVALIKLLNCFSEPLFHHMENEDTASNMTCIVGFCED